MKKIFVLLVCAIALLAVSCVEDNAYDVVNIPSSSKDNNKDNNTPSAPVGYSGLVLNELNGNDKFIELYNRGSETIQLNGVYIEKDGKNVWKAGSITLGAGEYLLLYSEDVIVEKHPEYDGSGLVFASGLSAKKAVRVQLFTPSGISIDDFNLVNYSTPASASYSRSPDGTGSWTYADATPSAANAQSNVLVSGLAAPEIGVNQE